MFSIFQSLFEYLPSKSKWLGETSSSAHEIAHDLSSDKTLNTQSTSHGSGNDFSIDVPVLIVGGGPTGLLLAYLLSKLRGL
jgi:heterodisulfide reductase subunit A-like polyferredoxin